ncbi:AtpZ/AtpI family protein [Bacillus sp. OK048]|uniref:AtpZ/AtpI family protein n=1 Tax=Bacillus sp. OK048 TaxID=1882761 RepID=UPI00087E2F6A|nr:AtpZ/AtpI family protein [Bacillus sp. OK048]SDN11603.1 Putative F0F1-ATPase subunit Ca2+/Mg2+ transporter [Bacillus sp. OK048]
MKHRFTKYLGRVTEILELGFEEKFIYVHYTKGKTEKTACILKNNDKSQSEYLEAFFKENNVSEEMKKEVRKFLNNENNFNDEPWNEFTTFLMKTLSLNLVFGLTVALTVFAFYKLGSYLDARYGYEPWLTVIFIFMGIAIGGLTGYSMIQKYFKKPDSKDIQNEYDSQKQKNETTDFPIIDVTIDQVRRAVRQFSDNLPKGVYRTIIVQDDNSIDFKQLANILGGIPSKKFYMSKETYDLFEESEKNIPVEMDMVQKAVDLFVKERKAYPMLGFDPNRRVNYYQLMQDNFLKSEPEVQFYITDLDGLITHIRPEKKKIESSSQ